jgi:DNA-directed RNA polymerase specialized sigma24 family protein
LAKTADPDEELVRRVGQGDPAAIQAMVARKLPRMLMLAQRMLGDATEAEDVAQEAMLRAWRQAPRWAPGQAKFDTWLHRVGLNLCYALAKLPERQREAIVLCHYQEMGNIEAAGLMNVSVEALESLLSRGRRALRTALADMAPHAVSRANG